MIPRRIFAVLLLLAPALACEWSGVDRHLGRNQRPSIRITGGATEGSTTSYRAEFFWFASDPDGVISYFQYAIDDTCLCKYEVETSFYIPEQDTTIVVTEVVAPTDPDSCRAHGLVPSYESPDSIWSRTERFSGTFEFSATTPDGGEPPLATDWHRFMIRAVDDRGALSDLDSRLFNAETIAPTVHLISPTGEGVEKSRTVSSFVSIRWFGRDEDGTHVNKKPVGYQLKLVELNNIYEPEDLVLRYLTSQFISRPNTLIPETLIVETEDDEDPDTYLPTDWWPKVSEPYPFESMQLQNVVPGDYAFAVRAVDQAGAVMPDELHRLATEVTRGSAVKLDVNANIPVRPFIRISEKNLLGSHSFIANSEEWRVEVPVNSPLRFEWTVDTSHYGARPAGTNYALDVPDPGCEVCQEEDGIGGWIGWGSHDGMIADLTFSDDQAGEQHVLYVRARDESFREERQALALVVMDVIGFSLEKPALWVDDFKATGVSDCTHDGFMRSIIEPAIEPYLEPGEELATFDARRSSGGCQESSTPTSPKLSTMSQYETIFWCTAASGHGTALGHVTDPNPDVSTGKYLSVYLRAGGNLVVWGRYSAGALLGDLYLNDQPYTPDLPIFQFPNYGPGTFIWDSLRLRTSIDAVGRGTSRSLSPSCSGIIGMEATASAIEEGFPAGVPDPTGYDTGRTAIWFNRWRGARNDWGAVGANGFTGSPPVRVAGMDTLYTYVSNSWSYALDGPVAVRDACGTAFLSPFESNPVVLRFRDPLGFQGNAVWLSTPLHIFSDRHTEDVAAMMGRLVDWIHMIK